MSEPTSASGDRKVAGSSASTTGDLTVAARPNQQPGRRGWLRNTVLVVVLAGLGFALWYGVFRDVGPKDDLGRLQGEWTYSVHERNNLGVIRVEGDTWSFSPMGQAGKSYRITLRSDATPKEIDLAQLGEDGQPVTTTHGTKGSAVGLHGVYAIDGDSVRVVFASTIEPRPTTFDDGEAPALNLTRMKK